MREGPGAARLHALPGPGSSQHGMAAWALLTRTNRVLLRGPATGMDCQVGAGSARAIPIAAAAAAVAQSPAAIAELPIHLLLSLLGQCCRC